MFNLRCTRKLLDRLPVAPAADDTASTTALGDWYATILPVRPAHLVLLVNEPSRLPVVLPARELATLFDRIPHAIAETLRDLEVPAQVTEQELEAMRVLQCTPTKNRSVQGSPGQVARCLLARAFPNNAPGVDKAASGTASTRSSSG